MTMPPLPVSAANFYPGVSSNEWVPGYTPAQMRDYARAAIAAHAGNIAAVPAQPVAWLSGDGHPHHISALQTITERRIHGPWQPLYAAPQAVPAGWVMVPMKPTQAMRDALRTGTRRDYPSDELCNVRYAAMLAAAPKESNDE